MEASSRLLGCYVIGQFSLAYLSPVRGEHLFRDDSIEFEDTATAYNRKLAIRRAAAGKTAVLVSFTYDRYSSDWSSDEGTGEESHGFYVPGLGCFDGDDPTAGDGDFTSAREAIAEICRVVGSPDSIQVCGDRLTVYPADSEDDYTTGDSTSYAAHVVADHRLISYIAEAIADNFRH